MRDYILLFIMSYKTGDQRRDLQGILDTLAFGADSSNSNATGE